MMKFRNRLLGVLLFLVISFWSLAMFTKFSITDHRDDSDEDEDVMTYSRRNLNVAESNSMELNTLLRNVRVANLSKLGDKDLGEVLLKNKTLADSWIRIGHYLQHQKQTQFIISVKDPHKTDQFNGIIDQGKQPPNSVYLNATKTKQLVNILYKTLGFKFEHRKNEKLGKPLHMFKNATISEKSPTSKLFQVGIRKHSLYSDQSMVDNLLSDMANQPIIDVIQMEGGTQLKLKFTIADKSHVVFKPMRFPREVGTLPNHFYFSDYERHIAEIAAFHLDRILDFRRVPPVTGRVVNITQDIWRLVTKTKKFEKTFFISPAGNVCFHGKCDYYCDTGHAICGNPELLEGSMQVFLPPMDTAKRHRWRNPWRRSYSKRKKAAWEIKDDFCATTIQHAPYDSPQRMLDVMDISVFDFLTGNMDRHHYETFMDFGNDTFPVLFDNGRGFGKATYDDMTILAPLIQCCVFRASTLHKFLKLHTGAAEEKLSSLMTKSLEKDPLPQVLLPAHLIALDRRVEKVLSVISDCVDKSGNLRKVVIDDGL